eukprot:3784169-Prymnesium_polylepis.1
MGHVGGSWRNACASRAASEGRGLLHTGIVSVRPCMRSCAPAFRGRADGSHAPPFGAHRSGSVAL